MDGIKLFSVCMDEGNVRISKVKTFPTDSLPPAYQLTFTPDNGRLIIAGYDRLIYVVDLLDGAFTVLNQFDLVAAASSEATEKKKKKRDTKESNKLAGHMAVSSDGQWLALATLDKCVHLIHLDSDKIHSHIPSFDSPITSLTFHPSSACLVITLSSNLFYLYDPDAATFTDWTREYVSRLPDRFANRKEVIMGCAFDAVRPGVMTLWGAYYFCTIDLQKVCIYSVFAQGKVTHELSDDRVWVQKMHGYHPTSVNKKQSR